MSAMTYADPRHAPVRTPRRLAATAEMNLTPMRAPSPPLPSVA